MASASTGDQGAPQLGRLQAPRFIPPAVRDNLMPSLKVGMYAGVGGFCTGFPYGIVKDLPPIVSGLALGTQWFYLSAIYAFTRNTTISLWGGDECICDRDRIYASAIAGFTTGTTNALTRGPHTIVPGAIAWTIGAAGIQVGINKYYRDYKYAPPPDVPKKPLLRRIMEHQWSPVRLISDDQFTEYLEEKILQTDVDMELLQERIDDIKKRIVARDARRAARKMEEARKAAGDAFAAEKANEQK